MISKCRAGCPPETHSNVIHSQQAECIRQIEQANLSGNRKFYRKDLINLPISFAHERTNKPIGAIASNGHKIVKHRIQNSETIQPKSRPEIIGKDEHPRPLEVETVMRATRWLPSWKSVLYLLRVPWFCSQPALSARDSGVLWPNSDNDL